MSQSTQAAAPGRPTWENERLSLMKEFESFHRHSVQTVQAEHSHVQETLTNQVEQLQTQFQNQIAIHDTRERELSGTLASTQLELEQLKSKSTSPDPLLLGKRVLTNLAHHVDLRSHSGLLEQLRNRP